jgi:hypothetical protein
MGSIPNTYTKNPRHVASYKHSITVAEAARLLAKATNILDPEKSYCYGLMHDVGKFHIDANRSQTKPSESELLLGDTEHRSGVYRGVHEHSSTGSTQQETDCGGFVIDIYKHPRLGYDLLKSEVIDIAEICISHSFPDFHSIDHILQYCRGDRAEAETVYNILQGVVRTDYVDLIQLCDKVSGISGYMTLDSKFDWYFSTGVPRSKLSDDYIATLNAIKSKFDSLTGMDVYEILGVE